MLFFLPSPATLKHLVYRIDPAVTKSIATLSSNEECSKQAEKLQLLNSNLLKINENEIVKI